MTEYPLYIDLTEPAVCGWDAECVNMTLEAREHPYEGYVPICNTCRDLNQQTYMR